MRRTSAGQSAVPYGEHPPVPVVRQPDFGEGERPRGRVRRDGELDTTECGQVRHVDARVLVRDVHEGFRSEVGRWVGELNVGDVVGLEG